MRKINKEVCIATKYEKWVAEKEKAYLNGKKIPKYDVNDAYFTKDVFIALLYCQNGLCAYTEKRLLELDILQDEIVKFDDSGKYQSAKRPECAADIEHFDSKLKDNPNGWAWDNFFVVYAPINQKVKRQRELEKGIDYILKPDLATYNPFALLQYDTNSHIFYANEDENDRETCEKIEDMIYVLGLNYAPIKNERKAYLEAIWEKEKINKIIDVKQFMTAYEMAK